MAFASSEPAWVRVLVEAGAGRARVVRPACIAGPAPLAAALPGAWARAGRPDALSAMLRCNTIPLVSVIAVVTISPCRDQA